MENLIKQEGYKVLAEDANTLEFKQININDKVLNMYQIYEVDHTEKVIYLELIEADPAILITTSDNLELPLSVVKNLNEAAEFMNVEATHLYRAYRNAGRPERLEYKDYILIKI